MKLKLPEHLIQKLVGFPESGMGYQNVTVKFADGSSLTTRVFNSEFMELPDNVKYIQEIVDVTINKEE